MNDVTQVLNAIETGDSQAAAALLPLVYDELRRLATQKLSHESAGQTLQATALVHEAYIRLVDAEQTQPWHGRSYFFAAAAEAMRRILVENARRKGRIKHGGELQRVELPDVFAPMDSQPERLIELDAALEKLEAEDAQLAGIVKLHFFAGQSLEDVGKLLGVSRASVYRQWSYARSWIKCAVSDDA